MPADFLRRFTATPSRATLTVDGARVVVSTNRRFLADRLQDAWGSSAPESEVGSVFNWRIVVEPDDYLQAEVTSGHHLSHDGLALITIGQNSFLACDLRTREGVGFIPQCLVNNEDLFQGNLLPALKALVRAAVEISSARGC